MLLLLLTAGLLLLLCTGLLLLLLLAGAGLELLFLAPAALLLLLLSPAGLALLLSSPAGLALLLLLAAPWLVLLLLFLPPATKGLGDRVLELLDLGILQLLPWLSETMTVWEKTVSLLLKESVLSFPFVPKKTLSIYSFTE